MAQNKIYIYGRHALEEVLTNAPRAVRKIYFAREMRDQKLRQLAKESRLPIEDLDERKVTSWVEGNAPHQGAVALITLTDLLIPFEKWLDEGNTTAGGAPQRDGARTEQIPSKESVYPKAVGVAAGTSLVLLNEVQDPHNVGAIIRSAAAFGASAVLMPESKQSPVTGAVIKASAGMAFSLPLVQVKNIPQAVSELKKKGFRAYGLAGEGKQSLSEEQFDAPALFILGNESKGLPQKTAQICDRILSIPIEEHAESLNVAAAAAITLYAWHTKHPSKS
ncbi:MAG TPA: 23S rRNA (guanosine(2251)-2'-O)-methyltransferase RlmB [Candidatus Paceibacterota bacterium]|nr:23S rRNA (guanosine(2251)-2'-O)-methyltransferase RlmB [Candidatus Paceibacterota bacterium]